MKIRLVTSLIVINILMFIVISYINIKIFSIFYNFNLMHGLPVIKYNHTYVTLYYALFVGGIIIKNSEMKKDKTKKIIYITLFSIGFFFGVLSIYKYYKISEFINIFSFSSASILVISWIYHYLNKKTNEKENE